MLALMQTTAYRNRHSPAKFEKWSNFLALPGSLWVISANGCSLAVT
jgi:hypothetical protein